jgi:maltooligosyltrehalose trehalohydrolase
VAPGARRIDIVFDSADGPVAQPLEKEDEHVFAAAVRHLPAGARYRFRLDGAGPFPDPASRFQPLGAHGPSEVVDPLSFHWSDGAWRGIAPDDLVFYELHVGTFTPAGTFAGVIDRLRYLVDLGVTAVELMPVAEFAGSRNWGYDSAALFAPSHAYGAPDDLRRLVDRAHAAGLAIYLDVVYNHLGPDGAYLAAFWPSFFSPRHKSPWGKGVNLDGPGSDLVRRFLIENALYWLQEFHVDGLRLDATHALADDSDRPFLADLADAVHGLDERWRRLVVAEDERNLDRLVRDAAVGGFGLDGVWADDFHHEVHRQLTGEAGGYYGDYSGSPDDIARTIDDGWFYRGQHSRYFDAARGTDPAGIPAPRFVFCLQNHDQVGNRARGERLNQLAGAGAYRAASALLLVAPETPLLFMGQEWAAATPFQYFTDHREDLGRLVTEGRRKEYGRAEDPAARQEIPDPQDESTFSRSRLRWDELDEPAHAGVLRLYHTLLRLRRDEPALRASGRDRVRAVERDGAIILARRAGPGLAVLLAVRLAAGAGSLRLGADVLSAIFGDPGASGAGACPRVLLTTDDAAFAVDPRPPRLAGAEDLAVDFLGPSAILLAWP